MDGGWVVGRSGRWSVVGCLVCTLEGVCLEGSIRTGVSGEVDFVVCLGRRGHKKTLDDTKSW